MRSRDGNNYRLLTVFSVIFFYSLVLNASEYLISYRYVVKDMILFNESLQISQAMQKCNGTPHEFLKLEHNNSVNLKKIIHKNYETFINFIHRIGLNLEHKSISNNAIYTSKIIFTLKTTCFKVDFNDYFVKISLLK